MDSASSSEEETPAKRGRFSVLNAKGRRRRKDDDEDWRRAAKREEAEAEEEAGESQADVPLLDLLREVARRCPRPGAARPPPLDRQPDALRGITLKPYQLEGVNWLIQMHDEKVNCILGDEMGLGKTVQSIAYLTHLKARPEAAGDPRPFLVLCPLTLVQTWAEELARCAPALAACKYIGTAEERLAVRSAAIKHAEDCLRRGAGMGFLHYDVVITTPDIILMDDYFLLEFHWRSIVIDEAHRLKNPKSKLYTLLVKSVRKADHLVLLTGTPVQNNMRELWALLHFLAPDLFTDVKTFTDVWFPQPKLTGAQADGGVTAKALQELLAHFLLRRNKATVLRDLPPKREYLLYAPLSPLQRRLYQRILRRDIRAIFGGSKKGLANIVMQLRKCCNHPYLFEGVEPEPFIAGEHLIANSSKMVLIDKLLKQLYDTGHKVLLFSQMTTMLDILQDFMDFRGYEYERLDGSVRGEDRFTSVKRFQRRETFAFLLSTRAGGLGLTLTAADTVVFVDSDWNPQVDIQAQERAHRIGQTQRVTIYRLICKETVEDIILKRALMKIRLTHAVLGNALTAQAEDVTNLVDIIKFGAATILGSTEPPGSPASPSAPPDDAPAADPQYAAFLASTMDALLAGREPVTYAQAVQDASQGPESVYVYQGTDYKEVADRPREAADAAALQGVLTAAEQSTPRSLAEVGRTRTAIKKALTPEQQRELEERRVQQRQAALERQRTTLDTPEGRREKEERRLSRLGKRWLDAGYVSLALPLEEGPAQPDAGPALDEEDEEDTAGDAGLHHVVGDVTHPVAAPAGPTPVAQIIVHCVNNSGEWSGGGIFRSLDKLSPNIAAHYESAKENQDLRLGDAHCVPVKDDMYAVAVVAQRSSTASASSGGTLDLGYLEAALRRLQGLCRKLQAGRPLPSMEGSGGTFMRLPSSSSPDFPPPGEVAQSASPGSASARRVTLHFPHFGTPKEWYTAERLIKKYLRRWATYVYYFPRRAATAAASSPRPTTTAISLPASSPVHAASSRAAANAVPADSCDGRRFHLSPALSPEEAATARRLILLNGGLVAATAPADPPSPGGGGGSSPVVEVWLVPDRATAPEGPPPLGASMVEVQDMAWLRSQTGH
eukprot:EG_transcript_1160